MSKYTSEGEEYINECVWCACMQGVSEYLVYIHCIDEYVCGVCACYIAEIRDTEEWEHKKSKNKPSVNTINRP